jgi:ABC-type transport system involved in Fe-S cluster assembly fused permease/ATPase subunit
MAQILFRIIELRSGSMEIDGIDISTLGSAAIGHDAAGSFTVQRS